MHRRKPAYAGIICPLHIYVDLSEQEYHRQMDTPDDWRCPKCGMTSEFNDERYEELHPEEVQ